MPFVEIKQPKNFVRVKSDGRVTISVHLIRAFFKDFTDGLGCVNANIKVYHDVEGKKIGLKPTKSEGYKLMITSGAHRIKCMPLSRIVTGEFYPKWSKKHKMLVFSYA